MNRSTIAGSLVLASALAVTLHAQPPAGSSVRGSMAGREVLAQPAVQPDAPARRVRVDVGRMKASSIVVEQPSGRGAVIDAASSQVFIKPWQYVAARMGTEVSRVEPQAGQTQAWSLPMLITTANDAGVQLDLEIVLSVDNGLMLRGDDGVYSGDVYVGVVNKANRTATDQLGQPVHILLAGQVDTIDPAAGVEIKHTNLPYEKVMLRARTLADRVTLKARASFTSQDSDVPIPVVRPRLILNVSPSKIQGMGVETAVINVRTDGYSGPKGRAVTLGTTAGWIEPAEPVTLDERGVATARLRGDGLGATRISASSDGFRDADVHEVDFGWPIPFVTATLAGGLLGAFLKYRRRRGSRNTRQAALLKGMAQGFAAALLYAIGINIAGWAPKATGGFALVLGIAFLGAWTNLSGLKK